jgi:hypothetical protein
MDCREQSIPSFFYGDCSDEVKMETTEMLRDQQFTNLETIHRLVLETIG